MKAVLIAVALAVLLPASAGAQAADKAGEVSALLPVGHIQRGTNPPAPAKLQDPIFWRDWFETEARGRARLALLDGSHINVGSEARLQVLRPQGTTQQTEVELQFGKLRNQVIGAPGKRFEVRTDSAVVGVIGTHFYVSRSAGLTTVINFDGKVAVRNADASVTGEETLEPFELAEVDPGKPPRKRLATLEEILRALEDTLPGPVMRLQPWQASVGSCVNAIAQDQLRAATDAAAIAQTAFFEVRPQACSGPDVTPVRICVPPSARPGVYDYALDGADGSGRWGAFLVRQPTSLEGARLIVAPELTAGATHYGRVVGEDGQPLVGALIRIRVKPVELELETDANGGFTFQVPQEGSVEITLGVEGKTAAGVPPPGTAPRATVKVVERVASDLSLPDFSERGSIVNLPGDVRSVQLGPLDLPVARTRTPDGRTTSSVIIPPDAPAGTQPMEIEDQGGQRRRRMVQVYEILAGRLDQHALASGNETPGEFLVCVGMNGGNARKLRARITAAGPVQFRGKGAKGKRFEETFGVSSSGLLRIPFHIQAEKTGTSAAVPFTLTLVLSEN